jgi:hypothetical protein
MFFSEPSEVTESSSPTEKGRWFGDPETDEIETKSKPQSEEKQEMFGSFYDPFASSPLAIDSLSPPQVPETSNTKQARYKQILAKEEWVFMGSPIFGTIVGYSNGIVQLKPKGATEGTKPIERYANRFSPEDFDDIRFYANYHGIPFNVQRKR